MSSAYKPGDKVDLVILRKTDLGFVAKVNGVDEGLLYHSEIFKKIELKESLTGYIKKLRPNGEIDLLLESFGHLGVDQLEDQIIKALRQCKGFLPVNAKSSAEQVNDLFSVSRKKFKMAIGGLYKKRIIEFTKEGMKLLPPSSKG